MSAQLRVHGTMTVLQLKQLVKERDGLPLHRCQLHLVRGEEDGTPMSIASTLEALGLTGEDQRVDIVLAKDDPAVKPVSPSNDSKEVQFDWAAVAPDKGFSVSVGYSSKPVDETGTLQIFEVAEEEKSAHAEEEAAAAAAAAEEANQANPANPTVMMPDVHERRMPGTMEGQVLDGYQMLDGCGVDLPEEVCRAVLTSFEPVFNEIVPEHMEEFTNLTYLDLSGNNMPLEALDCIPALQELRLSCNAMRQILFTDPLHNHFASLQVLDLSYNFLSVDSVKELTSIPSLTDLNLAGNDIPALPPDLSGFKNLRKLSLRRNRLGQQYQPLPIIPPSLISARQSGKFSGLNNDTILVMTLDYIFLAALATIPILEELDISENHLQAVPPGLPRGFKRLKFLNISYNFIDDQRKIIPLIEWPSVEWLDVRGNLFNVQNVHAAAAAAANCTEQYPYLYRTLCEGRGIKIVITQPKPSYMHDEGHILRVMPPVRRVESAPLSRSRLTGRSSISGDSQASRISSARSQLSSAGRGLRYSPSGHLSASGRLRPARVKRVTDTDELAAIFGVEKSEARAVPAPDPMPSSLYDDDEDDIFLTTTADDFHRGENTKLVDPAQAPMKGFVSSRAFNSLRYVLAHPLKPVKNTQAPFEKPTASFARRQRPRRSYVINKRFTEGRRGRRPNVAEVYAKMEGVLDALDGRGDGHSGLRLGGPGRGDRSTTGVRAKRNFEKEQADVTNLLDAVNRNFVM